MKTVVVMMAVHPELKRGPELPSPVRTFVFGPFENEESAFSWVATDNGRDELLRIREKTEELFGTMPLMTIAAVKLVEIPTNTTAPKTEN